MKVDGNKPIETNRASGARARGASPSGFAPAVPEDTKPLAQVASTASLSGVDALLALQGVASPAGERQRAVRRGRDMLDMLDDIRRGLLEGAVSESTLKRLAGLANTKREDFVDPGLSQVLDDIDLRARVELAKLQYAGAR
ncbi:MAG: flagellar assembly protein FliX [Alphaproteobacteria bacterium]